MSDYTARRTMMVDTQVRPSDVTKFPIIEAMLTVPREPFVPRSKREAAYLGETLPLGEGRVLLEPRTLAKMLDALESQDAEETLSDVGADNVIYHHGSIAEGAPQHGPYDVIVVQGGVEALPDAIVGQLKEGGRIGCIFAGRNQLAF